MRQFGEHVMLNNSTRPTRFIALCLSAVVLTACGRSEGHKSGEDSKSDISNVKVVVESTSSVNFAPLKGIVDDIQQPVLFVIQDAGFEIDNAYYSVPDWGGGARLTSTNPVIGPAECYPPNFKYQYFPQPLWLAGNILHHFAGHGLHPIRIEKLIEVHDGLQPDQQFLSLAQGQMQSPCGLLRIYDLGKFVLVETKKLNEFTAPDKQTGASTSFRSYDVIVKFELSSAARTLVNDNLSSVFKLTYLFELDPVSGEWRFDKFVSGHTDLN
jgi:hypothetical protein